MDNWNRGRHPDSQADARRLKVQLLTAQIGKLLYAALADDRQAPARRDPNWIGFAAGQTPDPTFDPLAFHHRLIWLRQLRLELFPSDLFADPAWDMLIDLYVAHLEGRPISVSSACIASNAPQSTALRHIAKMQKASVVERRPDPYDGRRIYLRLTSSALKCMAEWTRQASRG